MNLFRREFFQCRLQSLYRSVDISLYDNLKLLNRSFLDGIVKVIEGDLFNVLSLALFLEFLALGTNLTGLTLGFCNLKGTPRIGNSGKTENLNRSRRWCLVDFSPLSLNSARTFPG